MNRIKKERKQITGNKDKEKKKVWENICSKIRLRRININVWSEAAVTSVRASSLGAGGGGEGGGIKIHS